MRKPIREDQEIKDTQLECREGWVDLAESTLRGLINANDFRTVKFVPETWGRDRGFRRELKVDGNLEPRGKVLIVLPDNGRQDLSIFSSKTVG